MGYAQLPQESELAKSSHHMAYIELDIHELSEIVELLKSSLQSLQTQQSSSPSPCPSPSSRFNMPAPAMPDLKQKDATANMPTCFQRISNVPTSFQRTSNVPTFFQSIWNTPTSSFQQISKAPTSFQGISNVPSSSFQQLYNVPSSFQSISNVPTSSFPQISNVPTSAFQSISHVPSHFPSISNVPTSFQSIFNVPASSFQSSTIPKPVPLPIGTKKVSSSSPSSSQASTPRSSSPLCPRIQNLPPAIASSSNTHGFSEIQGGVCGSNVSLANAQPEQLNITGKLSLDPVEEKEVSSRAAQESCDQASSWECWCHAGSVGFK